MKISKKNLKFWAMHFLSMTTTYNLKTLQPYVPTLLEIPVNSVLIYDVRVINVGWLFQSELQSEIHVQLKAQLPNSEEADSEINMIMPEGMAVQVKMIMPEGMTVQTVQTVKLQLLLLYK